MVDLYVGPENTHWVLHEKLLCYHSPFFRKIFYAKGNTSKTYGLPEEEDATFKTFVGWLYSSTLPIPREEPDIAVLFDLYLLAEKLQIPSLIQDILQVTREWYKFSDTYPGLRRVQYIYYNTEEGSPMRHMLVHSVARMLVLEKGIPKHWDNALKKNGQLAVDMIRAIQEWNLDEEVVPDARDDPAEAEELMEEEVQEEVIAANEAEENGVEEEEVEGEGEAQEEEAQDDEEEEQVSAGAEDDEEANMSSEDTVVESPNAQSRQASKGRKDEEKKGAQQKTNGVKKAGDDFVSGMEKLKAVSNDISLDDYGTLHH